MSEKKTFYREKEWKIPLEISERILASPGPCLCAYMYNRLRWVEFSVYLTVCLLGTEILIEMIGTEE